MRGCTFEEAKQIIAELSNCKILSGAKEFRGVTSKLRLQCACGNEFITDLHHFKGQNQRQCPACGRKNTTAKNRISRDELRQRLAAKGCEYVSGEYTSRRSKLQIRCSCGHLREISMNSVLYQEFSGLCAECSVRRQHDTSRLNIEDVSVLLAVRGLTLLSERYENAKSPLLVRCRCGREFETTYDMVVSGVKKPCCGVCSRRISSGELSIAEWLSANGFQYEREKTFPGCGEHKQRYRFDFYLPKENLCIEFDGQNHFRIVNYSGRADEAHLTQVLWDTQERDFRKDKFCAENGIDILRISYDEFNQIPHILRDKLIPR